MAGSIYSFDGDTTIMRWQRDLQTSELITSAWGTSSDIYFVGTEGLIVHYNGTDFRRLNSPTEVDLVDVWGTKDGTYVWACGHYSNNSESTIIGYDGSRWIEYWNSENPGSTIAEVAALSVWISEDDSVGVMTGNSLYWFAADGSGVPRPDLFSYATHPLRFRGNNRNDLFMVGTNGKVYHYNGVSWLSYTEIDHPDYYYRSVSVLNDIVVAVGIDFSGFPQRDIVVMGKRE